ncbi:MAG TPA: hypothetical protein VKH43_12400 [Thermoanaerobaculia bacterium]|nr:hypothetical protein [Thermoanaerobaculia bacterium]
MRRVLSIALLGLALFVGTLIIPGGRASAEKSAPVEVTNVPLPVTVGNFPAIQSVAGTVGATQSGVWNVRLDNPTPLVGTDFLVLYPDVPGFSCAESNIIARAGAVIETISVRIDAGSSQKPVFGMCGPSDSGTYGTIWVPLQLQSSATPFDRYVGTVTNVHAPIATSTAHAVPFTLLSPPSGYAAQATVTVIGTTPFSQR